MIHKFNINGLNIVLDVESGTVHVVTDAVFDVLDAYEKTEKNEVIDELKALYGQNIVEGAVEEIETLIKEGMLFTKSDAHLEKIVKESRKTVVKALCLLVAMDCNLNCKYCFAGEGAYNGGKSLMSVETGKKAIDFLMENSGNRKNLEVDFFGGEPLLNFDVVKSIVEYGRKKEKELGKNIRFTLTTNGVLLDAHKLEFINKEMRNVVLSIDGRREVNDTYRTTRDDRGTYDKIVPIFKEVAESRHQTDYYVRGTFTRRNLDFSADVLHLANLGFKQVSVEPVVGSGKSWHLTEEDIPAICAEYENLAAEIVKRQKEGNGFNFFHFMVDLQGGPCVYKRVSGCGAGTEYLAVTTEGDLYPCHQLTGVEGFLMGNVVEGVTNSDKFQQFSNCNIYTKETCRDCFAKYFCGGGCAANAFAENGDINRPSKIGCALQKKRTECALYTVAEKA